MEGQMKKSIIWNEYVKEIALMKAEIDTFTKELNKIDDSQWLLQGRREKIKQYCETLAKDLEFAYESETYVNQAKTCIEFLRDKATVFPYIETVIDTFISENIDKFSSFEKISVFEKSICLGANISPAGMSGIQDRHRKIDYNPNSSYYLIGAFYRTFESEGTPKQREIKRLKDKLEMLTKLLQEIIGIDDRILWLVYHQLVLDSLVKYLAENWAFTYPYFQDFESEESALSGYVGLELDQHYTLLSTTLSKDFFQFICWLAYKLDITDNFFSFAQRIASALPEYQKKNEYLKFKARILPQKNDSASASSSIMIILADKVKSLGAHKGILISTSGFQRGAYEYAVKHGIALLQIVNKQVLHINASCPTEQEERRLLMKLEFHRRLPHNSRAIFTPISWACSGVTSPGAND